MSMPVPVVMFTLTDLGLMTATSFSIAYSLRAIRQHQPVKRPVPKSNQKLKTLSAIKQSGRQDISGFVILVDLAEMGSQVGQHGPCELVNQRGAARVQRLTRLAHDLLTQGHRHGGVRNSRDDVVRAV